LHRRSVPQALRYLCLSSTTPQTRCFPQPEQATSYARFDKTVSCQASLFSQDLPLETATKHTNRSAAPWKCHGSATQPLTSHTLRWPLHPQLCPSRCCGGLDAFCALSYNTNAYE